MTPPHTLFFAVLAHFAFLFLLFAFLQRLRFAMTCYEFYGALFSMSRSSPMLSFLFSRASISPSRFPSFGNGRPETPISPSLAAPSRGEFLFEWNAVIGLVRIHNVWMFDCCLSLSGSVPPGVSRLGWMGRRRASCRPFALFVSGSASIVGLSFRASRRARSLPPLSCWLGMVACLAPRALSVPRDAAGSVGGSWVYPMGAVRGARLCGRASGSLRVESPFGGCVCACVRFVCAELCVLPAGMPLRSVPFDSVIFLTPHPFPDLADDEAFRSAHSPLGFSVHPNAPPLSSSPLSHLAHSPHLHSMHNVSYPDWLFVLSCIDCLYLLTSTRPPPHTHVPWPSPRCPTLVSIY